VKSFFHPSLPLILLTSSAERFVQTLRDREIKIHNLEQQGQKLQKLLDEKTNLLKDAEKMKRMSEFKMEEAKRVAELETRILEAKKHEMDEREKVKKLTEEMKNAETQKHAR
jgi:KaiC/GvpD/RAD55 family RecA-like ATPase